MITLNIQSYLYFLDECQVYFIIPYSKRATNDSKTHSTCLVPFFFAPYTLLIQLLILMRHSSLWERRRVPCLCSQRRVRCARIADMLALTTKTGQKPCLVRQSFWLVRQKLWFFSHKFWFVCAFSCCCGKKKLCNRLQNTLLKIIVRISFTVQRYKK